MAAHAALYDVRIPRTRPITYEGASKHTAGGNDFLNPKSTAVSGGADVEMQDRAGIKGALTRGTGGKAVDFELLDSGEGGETLLNRDTLPVCISVYALPNGEHLLDPTLAESSVLTSRVHVLADRDGRIYGVHHANGPSQEDSAAGDAASASAISIGTESKAVKAALRIGAGYAKQLAGHLQSLLKA